MNKFLKYSLVGTTFGFGLILGGCTLTPPTVASIAIASDAPTEILINEFNYEDYNIVVTYSNDSTKIIPITEDMLDPTEYLNAIKKEGNHTITISYAGFECTYSFAVKKYEFTDVYIEDQTIVYDGLYHSLEVSGNVPKNTAIEFIDKNSYKNANEEGYEVTARLSNEYYKTKTITGKLTILKANYDASVIKFEDTTYTYDGQEKSIEVKGLDSAVKVSYSIGNDNTNKRTDAGVYEVVAHFEASANYNNIPDMTAKLIIEKATYDMTPYKFADKTVYYTGEKTDMHISNEQSLPSGVTVSYVGLSDAINAGTYEIIARFKGDVNYNDIPDIKGTLTIKPAVVGLTGVYLDSQSVVYDGKEHGIEYSGNKPNSIIAKGYTIYNQYGELIYDSSSLDLKLKHKAIDVGTYVVYAHFAYRDTRNYAEIEPLSATLIIEKADITDIEIVNESKEYIPGMGQSLTVRTGMAGIIATPSIANPVDPGDYVITYTFTLSEELAKNYNVPDPITRTLSITKRNIFADKNTQTKYEATYDGQLHGIEIALSVDEAKWIQPYFFVYNESQEEVPFVGYSEPGTYLIFARFTIDETKAPANYENYYYIPNRASAYLQINKKQIEFDETWLANRMNIYDGATVEVKLNTTTVDQTTGKTGLQSFLAANPGLNESDFTITYKNNHGTDTDYYTGSLDIKVSSTKEKYFENLTDYEFHFAIKKSETEGEEVNPSVLQKTYSYDGKSHSVILSDIPDGISIMYDGEENTLTLPGSKQIIILFHCDNDVAKWYYDFPGLITSLSGDPQLIVQLTVLHINYEPELNIPTYYYEIGSENREIYVKKPEAGVDVYFEYDVEERVNVGTYDCTVYVTITNTELLKIYNATYSYRTSFSIVPTDYKFSFAGLSAIYDGNKHNVIVTGIDEEVKLGYISYQIEDQQGHVIDGYTDVGIYNVFIRFQNNSANYNDVPNQSLQLVIETSKVKTQDLVDYVNNTTYARVNQLETVYSLLNSIIDTTPFDVIYKVDYYAAPENPQYPDDPLFHSGECTTNDFTFTQFTLDSGYALLEFTVTFKKGYESKDGAFLTSYHGFIRVKVLAVNEYDISSVLNNLRNNHTIQQGSTLEETYLNALEGVEYSYTCEYQNAGVTYDTTRYPFAIGNSTDNHFNFAYNTFGNKKVKVTLTIPAVGKYLFYDGIHSVSSVEEVFEFDVTIKDTIDIYNYTDELLNASNFDQFSYYEDYIKNYYNADLYELDYVIKDSTGTEIANKLNEGYVPYEGTFIVNLTFTGKNSYKFLNNNQNTFTMTQTLTTNHVDNVQIGDYLTQMEQLPDSVDMYNCLWETVVYNKPIPEGLNVEYVFVDADGKNYSGNLADLTCDYYQGYVFTKYDNSLEVNHLYLQLTLSSKSNYVLVDNNGKVYSKPIVINKTFVLNKKTQISYYNLYKSIEKDLNANGRIFKQYRTWADYFGSIKNYVNDIKAGHIAIDYICTYSNALTGEVTTMFDSTNKTIDELLIELDQIIDFTDYNINDHLIFTFNFRSTDPDYVVTDNPQIRPNTTKKLWWAFGFDNYQTTSIDETLNNKLAEVTANNYVLSHEQYTNLTNTLKTNIIDYANANGPVATSYTVELVNKDTKVVDNSFIKVTKNISESYSLDVKNADNRLFKVTIKYDNTKALAILTNKGTYQNNPEYVVYVNVIPYPAAYNMEEASSYVVPEFKAGGKVVDTINAMGISDKLNVKSWKVNIYTKGTTTVVTNGSYSGNGSSTVEIPCYFDPTNYDAVLSITYEMSNPEGILIKNGLKQDISVFTQDYTFKMKKLTTVSLDKLDSFNDSNYQFYLVGYSPNQYTNYLLNGVTNYITYTAYAVYETSDVEHGFDLASSIQSSYEAVTMTYEINAKDGYYFGVDSTGKPKYEIKYQIRKAVKTQETVNTKYLKDIEVISVNGANITNYTVMLRDCGYRYDYDYTGYAYFTYTNLFTQNKSHYFNRTFVSFKTDTAYTSFITIEWKVEIASSANSNLALRFANDDDTVLNPIGYRGNYPNEAYGSFMVFLYYSNY